MEEEIKMGITAVVFQPTQDGKLIYMDQAVLQVKNFELTPEIERTLQEINELDNSLEMDKVEQAKQALRETGVREEDIAIVDDRRGARKQMEQDGFDR